VNSAAWHLGDLLLRRVHCCGVSGSVGGRQVRFSGFFAGCIKRASNSLLSTHDHEPTAGIDAPKKLQGEGFEHF
jgi:hypothetical protein